MMYSIAYVLNDSAIAIAAQFIQINLVFHKCDQLQYKLALAVFILVQFTSILADKRQKFFDDLHHNGIIAGFHKSDFVNELVHMNHPLTVKEQFSRER